MKKKRKSYYRFMTKFLTLIIIGLITFIIIHYATFNHHKVKVVTKIKYKEVVTENIVFLGDSITKLYDLNKYYPDNHVVNSGISGDKTEDIIGDMYNRVYKYNPSKVFLLIGTNQIERDSEDEVVTKIMEIISEIHDNRPKTKVYLESIYPVNGNVSSAPKKRDNDKIKRVNEKLEQKTKENSYTYINIYDDMIDENGNLKEKYTYDGLHLSDRGFAKITEILEKYIKD